MADVPHGRLAAGPATPPWLRHALIVVLRHAASAVLILGLLWAVARPHAEEFIQDTVNDRLELLEMQMNDVRQSSRDMQREQAVMANDLDNLKALQRDTKRDTRMILQSLRRSEMRNEQ